MPRESAFTMASSHGNQRYLHGSTGNSNGVDNSGGRSASNGVVAAGGLEQLADVAAVPRNNGSSIGGHHERQESEGWMDFDLNRQAEDDSQEIDDALHRSMEDQGGAPVSDRLRTMRLAVMNVGQDDFDENVSPAALYRDPLTLNWLVDPVQYGTATALVNKATVEFLREEARLKGNSFVVHPVSKEQIGVSVEPIPNRQAGEMIHFMYEQALGRYHNELARASAPTAAQQGHVQQAPNRSRS